MYLVAILLVIVAAVFGLGLCRRRKSERDVRKVLDTLRELGGWLEITDNAYSPMFQGKLLTVTDDSYGLAIGVLLEAGRNPDLIRDLKAARRIDYVGDGRILAKAAIDFGSHVILTGLTDADLRSALQSHVDLTKDIDVKLLMNSVEIQFVNSPEDEQAFSDIWDKVHRQG